jgi:hypothetical protein
VALQLPSPYSDDDDDDDDGTLDQPELLAGLINGTKSPLAKKLSTVTCFLSSHKDAETGVFAEIAPKTDASQSIVAKSDTEVKANLDTEEEAKSETEDEARLDTEDEAKSDTDDKAKTDTEDRAKADTEYESISEEAKKHSSDSNIEEEDLASLLVKLYTKAHNIEVQKKAGGKKSYPSRTKPSFLAGLAALIVFKLLRGRYYLPAQNEKRPLRIFELTIEGEKTIASSFINQLGLTPLDRREAEGKSIWSWYSHLRKQLKNGLWYEDGSGKLDGMYEPYMKIMEELKAPPFWKPEQAS